MDLKRYLIRRFVFLVPVMLCASVITFCLSSLAPGDPAEMILRLGGTEPTRQAIEALRAELGLDGPVHVRYVRWIQDVLRLDLGKSYRTGRPVTDEILGRFPATVELTVAALCVMLLVALPSGILSALYPHSFVDHISRIFSLVGASMPSFWLGLMLVNYLAVQWGLFPVMGRGGWKHLVLPAATLGFGMAAIYTRVLRASMLEVLSQDYIKVARAKGLAEKWVISRHALRNALIPVVTLMGMSLGHLLGGVVIVETVFAWPGVGKFVLDAIFSRDYPVIQGYVLLMSLVFVTANFLVDVSYAAIDPRIRFATGTHS